MAPNEEKPQWLLTAERKRQIRTEKIKAFAQVEDPEDAEAILAVDDAGELAAAIARGKWRVYDVVLAYVKQAIRVHEKTNCLTEILFQEALTRARELDALPSPIGPLHGIPMTVKDQFNITGHDSSLGYIARAFSPATSDADVVSILRDAGVIFIAKTNLPQSIMWCETENNLFGLTTHPLGKGLTPGGSTGGEGALISAGGSLFGWGTDLGGSVRIPAHLCGLYGLRSGAARLPYEGVPVSTEGQEHVPSAIGPLARSLSSIHLITKHIIDQQPWKSDPRCVPIRWREEAFQAVQQRPLVIGLMIDDGVVKVHPPVERVVREAAAKLKAAGHTIVPWSPEGHAECMEVMDLYFTADGGEDIKRDVNSSGEPFVPHVQNLVSRSPAISVWDYWQLNRRKRAAQKAYLEKWHNTRCPETGREVDILLTPVMPHAAVPHRHCRWVGYTKFCNLLDYTALVMPGGEVDKAVDAAKDDSGVLDYKPRNEQDEWNWKLYEPEAMHGLPVGIQIVGQQLEEEKVLGAARVVEEILKR